MQRLNRNGQYVDMRELTRKSFEAYNKTLEDRGPFWVRHGREWLNGSLGYSQEIYDRDDKLVLTIVAIAERGAVFCT